MASFTDKENLNENESESLNQALRTEFSCHFNSISLSSHQKQAIESLLFAHSIPRSLLFINFLVLHRKSLFSHFITAAAAVVCTLLTTALYFQIINQPPPRDLISEVVSLSDNLNFPADFNLDGNLNDLPDLINDSLPKSHSFSPAVPKQIAQDFSAYEGRFFLFNGEQGVGISVLPSAHHPIIPIWLQGSFERNQSSTLYIVKLSDKNKSTFPSQKMSRKIFSASGKLKRVYAWRDGTYGYAMVQPMAPTTNDFLESQFP